jgi:hypothetical protein
MIFNLKGQFKMVEDSDNRELEKEDTERKRLHDEMMASLSKAADKWKESKEQVKQRELEVTAASEKSTNTGFYIIVIFCGAVAIVIMSLKSAGFIVTFLGILGFVFVGSIFVAIFGTPEQKNEMAFGQLNPHMNCPHCNTSGNVRTKSITQKKGVSGGKAVAGILTGGVSLLAVGLSRKEDSTQAHCQRCNNTWQF